MENYYNYIDFNENILDSYDIDFEDLDKEYTCCICFDTSGQQKQVKLYCTHNFHTLCLKNHIENNDTICPMCRGELTESDSKNLQEVEINQSEWIINPVTKRRVKIGGRTYLYLKENNII